ncbi:hypothetical protein P9112_000709 [Eukaryota sp. TZLM1-RC]
MRCFLWPCSVPNDLICRCGQLINLNHLFNYKFNIRYRSVVHDAVRDQLYAMCKSHHLEAFVELLVRRLSSKNEDENTFGKRCADLITPGSDGVNKVVDVVTVDVCKDSAIDFAKRDETPLCFAEKSKIKKYNEFLSQLGRVEHVKYQLVPFAVSLFGNIGISGINFLEGFRSLIKERAGKELKFNFWHNRIVFSILKAIPEMLMKALLQLGIEYENRALKRFDDVDAFFLFNVLLALKINFLLKKQFGGVGFTKSSILCQAAFVDGGKNYVFECLNHFPEDIHLLSPSFSKNLYNLHVAINRIAPEFWSQCFPDSVQEIPPRNLVNLRYFVKKLQQKLTVLFEGVDYEVRLCIVKQKNPAFANYLLDFCDSSASCLINQVPRTYGLFLDDPCYSLSMRLRSFIWPDNLLSCGKTITPTHLFNCNRFRSKVHDVVRDQLYCMFRSYKIESLLEPLLSNLADEADRNSFGDSRGDVLVPGLYGSMIIIDVRSTDNSPLRRAEEAKLIKYAEKIWKMNCNSHTQYLLCPFALSLFGTLGKTAVSFIDDFSSIVKNKTGRIFDRTFWQNRIVFSIFKERHSLISNSLLLSLGRFYEENAVGKFSIEEVDFEEIDL